MVAIPQGMATKVQNVVTCTCPWAIPPWKIISRTPMSMALHLAATRAVLEVGYIITWVMMANWCLITIYYLVRGSSCHVSHSLLACSLQLSFILDQSHNSQWLTNTLLANQSDAQHVQSHQRKMLIFFTPRFRSSGMILNFQMKNSFSLRSPSSVQSRWKTAFCPLCFFTHHRPYSTC